MKSEDIIHNGRKVGVKIGNTYLSYRKQSKHLYRGGAPTVAEAKKRGSASWGIDAELVKLLNVRDVRIFAIHESETKKTYYMSSMRFAMNARYLEFDHGLQQFVELSKWMVADNLGEFIETCEKVV